jgi:hypothetical protein
MKMAKKRPNLIAGQDDREPPGALRVHETVEPGDLLPEHLAVEEQMCGGCSNAHWVLPYLRSPPATRKGIGSGRADHTVSLSNDRQKFEAVSVLVLSAHPAYATVCGPTLSGIIR